METAQDPIFVHVEVTFRYVDSPEHAERIELLRQRSWLIYDLLFGRVDSDPTLYNYLAQNGFSEEDLAYFQGHRAEPHVLGINYYPHTSTTEFLPDGERRSVCSGTEGIDELVRGFHARYGKPIFWTETSAPGTVEERLRWLEDSLKLVERLRSEGLPLVGYTWWPLFSLLDWAYREGEEPPEYYLWHMGVYDLEPDGRGNFMRTETPVAGGFREATKRISGR